MFQREPSEPSNDWRAWLDTLEMRQNVNNRSTVHVDVLEHETMQSLRDWLNACLHKYFREVYGVGQSTHLHICQSWANYSEPGQFHHAHRHQNSLISGVFYVQCNPDDKIQFLRDGYQQLQIHPETWNLYNAVSWWLPVNEGLLLLFPSDTIHEVPTVQGDRVRISIAFNTFPSGMIGTPAKLTRLELKPPLLTA